MAKLKTIQIKQAGEYFAVATIGNNGIIHYPQGYMGETTDALIFETKEIADQAKEEAQLWCNAPLHVIKLTLRFQTFNHQAI